MSLPNFNVNPLSILILDNGAFVAQFPFTTISSKNPNIIYYTTPEIYNEIIPNTKSKQIFETLELQNLIIIREPDINSINTIKKAANTTGDLKALSKADISIIALAISLSNLNSSTCNSEVVDMEKKTPLKITQKKTQKTIRNNMVQNNSNITKKNQNHSIAIITDDYSIQNVCKHLGIYTIPIRHSGIKQKIHWETYCPSCFHKYPPNRLGTDCDICGTTLIRRKRKKRKKTNR